MRLVPMVNKPKVGTKLICIKIPYFYAADYFTVGNIYTVLDPSIATSFNLAGIYWITNDKTEPFSIAKEEWNCFTEINNTTRVLYGK